MRLDVKLRHPALPGEVWICPETQEIILQYRQTGCFSREAGGILMGYRRGGHIDIQEASVPMSKDIRRRHGFERLDPGHQALADRRWKASGGTVLYLGEWHTHPCPTPHPSSIDRTEWTKLTATHQTPLTFIIGGTRDWYVECGTASWVVPMY